ncbi:lysylphosphatidylglycerol synthase domain-containing protein [Streptacidiphilus sp. MAP5-3]|uniref:lysylphosphatidylglycerol synthase domain-containing protein n=1 Tax=unclassified Streptacidiphilus TaxID=2643834 RepID=UPI003519941D
MPLLRESLATLGHLTWWWVVLAILAEFGSMTAFARSQRRLLPWRGLLLAYCLAKTAGSLGVTPGGVGIVEATLATALTALTAAGMPANQALPAVLVYRLISFWLLLAVGWTVLALLTRHTGPPDPPG